MNTPWLEHCIECEEAKGTEGSAERAAKAREELAALQQRTCDNCKHNGTLRCNSCGGVALSFRKWEQAKQPTVEARVKKLQTRIKELERKLADACYPGGHR